jgi:hypothetical protein
MLTFITDTGVSEPDILSPVAREALVINTLAGVELMVFPAPAQGWSHDQLMSVSTQHEDAFVEGADAYLGTVWVGSTEV